MSVIDLYENGTINYLFKRGLISQTVPIYMEYFLKFSAHRKNGMTHRESVAVLSQEYRVSSTTIKKGIKLIRSTVENE
jgi:hypothetical protein